METLTGGALLLFALVGLTFILRRRSRDGGGQRKSAHARAAGPGGDSSGSSIPGTSGARAGPGADGPDARDGERSSWAASAEEPDWPYPDHPSWPAGSTGRPLTPDHPSWPTGGLHRPIGYGRPGGTATDSPYGDHPSWPAEPLAPAIHHHDYSRPPAPHVPRARGRHVRPAAGYSGYPRPGVPTGAAPRRSSAQLARKTGPTPRAYYDPAYGDGGLQVVLTETPGGDLGRAASPGRAAGPGARSGQTLQLPGPGTAGGPVSWDTGEYGNADPVRVAERVLANADQQAAAIRQEATSQAVAIRETAEREAAQTRQQAAAEAAPIREAAEREAAEIKDRAAAQVATIREAADREIAELRATVLAMSDELRRVAEYVTETLTSPGQPTAPPPRRAGPPTLAAPVQPDADPSAGPAGRPPGKPGAGPGAKRRARPGGERAGKPGTSAKGRQVRAMHKMMAAFVTVSVVGVVAGAAEIALHGFPFFVFRANGAGASLTGLKEDQGPGQPDAPGAHRKAPAATPGAAAKTHHPGAKSKGKTSHGKKPQNNAKQHQGTQHHSSQPPGQPSPKPGQSG